MKIIAIILGSSLVFLTSYGQSLSVGPVVGLSQSKVKVDQEMETSNGTYSIKTLNPEMGFHAGGFVRASLFGFYIQPEALFTAAGGKVNIKYENTGTQTWNMKYNRLDFPVMFGKAFKSHFRINAGPVFSLMLSNDARKINLNQEIKQNYSNAVVGYQAGIGVDISRVYLDLKYLGPLSKSGKTISIGSEEFSTDFRTSQIILSLGINLL